MIDKTTLVRPAEDTPRPTLWLSSLDLTVPPRHIGTLYVYQPKPHADVTATTPPKPHTDVTNTTTTTTTTTTNANFFDSSQPRPNADVTDATQPNPPADVTAATQPNPHADVTNFFDSTVLKESLSRALVPFYALAGRIKEGPTGRLELECNAHGALFIEAETPHSLAEFGDFKPTPDVMRLVIPSCDDFSKMGLGSVPLLMVQVTRFRCGGVTLGFGNHKTVGDGGAFLHFINLWARMARGLELDIVPTFEREPYLLPRNPPEVKFSHPEFDPPTTRELQGDTEPIISSFKITPDQLAALKKHATSSEPSRKLSTFVVLSAHVLRTACKARCLSSDQEVKFYIPADGRYRLKNPALPPGFFGNAVFTPLYVATSGDIVGNTLGFVAGKIHDTVRTMTDEEYIRSTIDFLETHPKELTTLAHGPHSFRSPNLLLSSWLTFPFYEADFGWGRPVYAGRGGGTYEGLAYLVRGPEEEEGLFVTINLLPHHMELFEKYFYEF